MTAPTISDEQLLERARELAREEGGVRSVNWLAKSLGVRWKTAEALTDQLATERHRSIRARRHAVRAARSRKRRRRSPPRAVELRPVRPDAAPGRGVDPQVAPVGTKQGSRPGKPLPGRVATWPAQVVALPAYVAIWAGWVALGKMTGFGRVNLLPGIGDGWVIDTAITLPIGVEAYAAYAFYVWLHVSAPVKAKRFAGWSALSALLLGMGGQIAYHNMAAAGMVLAPWQITTFVSCLPVAVFGAAALLVRFVRSEVRR